MMVCHWSSVRRSPVRGVTGPSRGARRRLGCRWYQILTIHPLPRMGWGQVDTEAIATVSRHRPDGARLEDKATFEMDGGSGSRVVVEANGVAVFERDWSS